MYEENVILGKAITAMIAAEDDPNNALDVDFSDDDLHEDGYDGVRNWLRDTILNFPSDGESRLLRNLNFHLGEALQDCPSGVDDLIEAKAVYLKAMELSTLIAVNKTTIAEPDQSTIS